MSSLSAYCKGAFPAWTPLRIGVIHGDVEDIEAIIDASKHFKFHEPHGTTPFNRISALPESKRHLKMAIKERMRLLAAAYMSLATFIDDDLVDFLEEHWGTEETDETKRIFENVIEEMERLREEIRVFDVTASGEAEE